jgi:hypothetical protein
MRSDYDTSKLAEADGHDTDMLGHERASEDP